MGLGLGLGLGLAHLALVLGDARREARPQCADALLEGRVELVVHLVRVGVGVGVIVKVRVRVRVRVSTPGFPARRRRTG